MPLSQDDGPGPSTASPVASVLAGCDQSSCSCSCSLSSSSSGNSTPLIKIFPILFFLPALDRCVPPSPLRGCAARERMRTRRLPASAGRAGQHLHQSSRHGWGRPSPARGLPGSSGQRPSRSSACPSSSSSSASSTPTFLLSVGAAVHLRPRDVLHPFKTNGRFPSLFLRL